MKTVYQIMTFQPNGLSTPIENKKHSSREEAENRMNELKKVYELPMSVREIKGGK